MAMHLFVYPGADSPSTVPEDVTVSRLPSSPAAAATAVGAILGDPRIETLAFWGAAPGAVPWPHLDAFVESKDDAWHAGTRLSGSAQNDRLQYVLPLWVYRPLPPPELAGAINWHLDLRACFIRAAAVRAIGGLDGQFETLVGASHDLGLRMLRRGAICRQQPRLFAGAAAAVPMSSTDAYRLVGRVLGWKWQAYAAVRHLLDGGALLAELRAWRSAAADRPIPPVPVSALHRDLATAELAPHVAVSVVLPTFGRYRYLAEVLDDLQRQTIRPTQILIADGNPPDAREPGLYERYRDLPIEVIWHEEGGTCASRNACLERASGDFVWFVDDDSRIAPDNLEMHLRALSVYGADVSVGPAYTRERPELHGAQREIACTFMDCGTTVCRTELLEAVGGFDLRFNQYLAGEDGELGVRFVRAGGLMINNPAAKRFHYLAPVGGARRSKNNVHRWSRWSLLPRPVQSIYYTARRHFEPATATDAVLQACMVAGWRRKDGVAATWRWKVRTLIGELAALPLTAHRLRRSIALGREMIAAGPSIPLLTARPTTRAARPSR